MKKLLTLCSVFICVVVFAQKPLSPPAGATTTPSAAKTPPDQGPKKYADLGLMDKSNAAF